MRMQIDNTVRDMTPEEEAEFLAGPEPSEEEALTRFANEITGASDETLQEAAETLIKKVKEEN